ncbi:unnamed protein product [Ilex paraguariensis]|uniref:Uncharacterized protein n=1 Tax=Ilex paraguariensis TaxID=185542 RepID=A0ABC8R375_9AQUA
MPKTSNITSHKKTFIQKNIALKFLVPQTLDWKIAIHPPMQKLINMNINKGGFIQNSQCMSKTNSFTLNTYPFPLRALSANMNINRNPHTPQNSSISITKANGKTMQASVQKNSRPQPFYLTNNIETILKVDEKLVRKMQDPFG